MARRGRSLLALPFLSFLAILALSAGRIQGQHPAEDQRSRPAASEATIADPAETEPAPPHGLYDQKGNLFARLVIRTGEAAGRDEPVEPKFETELSDSLPELQRALELEAEEPLEFKQMIEEIAREIAGSVAAEIDKGMLLEGGLEIYTSVDLRTQFYARRALMEGIKVVRKRAGEEDAERPTANPVRGVALVIDNRTGAIRALVAGKSPASGLSRVMLVCNKLGSLFKPFVYAAALEGGGMDESSTLQDIPVAGRRVELGGTMSEVGIGEWAQETKHPVFEREIPIGKGLIFSKNTATARLGATIGFERVTELAELSGFDAEGGAPYLAYYLGDTDQTLASACRAYTIFPNGGKRPDALHLIRKVVAGGSEQPTRTAQVRVVSRETAATMHRWLAEVLATGTGKRARKEYGLGKFDAGGKTGTCFRFRNNWFVGYNSEVTCGVWLGHDPPQRLYELAFSSETALPIWTEIMNQSAVSFPPKEIDLAE